MSARAEAVRLATFLLEETRKKKGRTWHQGARKVPLPCHEERGALAEIATVRVYGIPEDVAVGLVAFSRGERPLRVFDRVLEPFEVLALQAEGERCASLLGPDVPTAPHEDARAFLIHDLCHLEKFVDPEHHEDQLGFFRSVRRATLDSAFSAWYASFDETFRRDFESVVCDMNGSSIFLFAALKMKLKMAARRRLNGAVFGPLDDHENAAYREEEVRLFDLLRLPPELRHDAAQISTKRDARESAVRVRDYFRSIGTAR